MARRSGGRGFWAGFLTGIAVSALAALALALIYPPMQPPVVDEGAVEAPDAPAAPTAGPLLTPAPGPVIDGLPEQAEPAGPAGPGSPSLVPPASPRSE